MQKQTKKSKNLPDIANLKSLFLDLKLPPEQIIKLLELLELKQKLKISTEDLKELVKKEYLIPISIFKTKLAPLESLVKYLKENLNFSYHKIATLLNRNDRTIWGAYSSSIKKRKQKFIIKKSEFLIPISVFSNRKLSILESLISYLKDEFKLSYHEIAELLQRDDRTIWTVYSRARKKYEK